MGYFNRVDGADSSYSSIFTTASRNKNGNGSEVGLDGFMTLLAAQMSNQDMNNPMSDAEFIGQLAQFSSLQAMNDLTSLNATTYSVGLLGQEVTAARIDDKGDLVTVTGTVTGIGLFDGDPVVYIGEAAYSLKEIMAVGKIPEEKPADGSGAEEPAGTEG